MRERTCASIAASHHTRHPLPWVGLEAHEVLLQRDDVLRMEVPDEGCGDLDLQRLTPVIPMLGEGVGTR